MTLPIQPCLRGPRRPPAAGVFILLGLLLSACDMPNANRMAGDEARSTSAEALIEAHSVARSGVTLGGLVLGPGEVLRTRGEHFSGNPEQL